MRALGPVPIAFASGVVVSGLVVGAFALGRQSSLQSPEPTTSVAVVTASPPVSNPLPGLLPDVPAEGCVADVTGDEDPTFGVNRLSYVAGALVVAATPGTSVEATFHMPNGDFTLHGVTNTTGERKGYAPLLFRLDNWTNPDEIPNTFKIVIDVVARQSSGTFRCATQFLAGT